MKPRALLSRFIPATFVAALALSSGQTFLSNIDGSFGHSAEAASVALYVDPSGNDKNDGSSARPLKSVKKALQIAQPGTSIKLRSGVYEGLFGTVRPGTENARIVIEPDGAAKPVIDGADYYHNGPAILHSYITFRGIEVRNVKLGVRIENATHVIFEDNVIHNVGSECVRIRYSSTENSIIDNKIYDCGKLTPAVGEGIYVGTAPEQRSKNGGLPDKTTHNVIRGNEIYRVTEGIDVKEDSWYTVIEDNHVHDVSDVDSGGINIRSDYNTIRNNLSEANAGSGFRAGGDRTELYAGGPMHQYGADNLFRDNISTGNGQYGFKLMVQDQDLDCGNTAADNDRGSFNGGFRCR